MPIRQTILFAAILSLFSAGVAYANERALALWDGDEEPGTVVIETGARRLNYILGAGQAISYQIAVGRPGATWFGETEVIGKTVDPTWRPTPSMRRKDPGLPTSVSPGPSNPLGVRAIYLAQGALRIHGTNAPGSIGRAASSGCFRMHNEDVRHLYDIIDVGAQVIVRR